MHPICATAQLLALPTWKTKIDGWYMVSETGCWEWTGPMDRSGYGLIRITIGGRVRSTGAHRASWIAHRGPIPMGLQIDHLCFNRKCINPAHLEPVTTQENTRRAANNPARKTYKTGRPPRELQDRRACKRHGKTDGYWRTRKDGYTCWVCRPCASARFSAWKAQRPGK